MPLPPRVPGTEVRILATNDLLGSVVPLPTTYGEGGSVHGVARMLHAERERGPALWLDSGDLSVGGEPFGERALDDVAALPIAAAAAGNHEFDRGLAALARTAARVGFPLLCADRDVGLPASVLLDTGAGGLGVVGITHPGAHQISRSPPPIADVGARIREVVAGLRRDGARWIVALVHDGVTWWVPPGTDATLHTRSDQLATVTRPWAADVDAILGGHTLGAWTGALHGVAAGHGHPYAASVICVDVLAPPAAPVIHPPTRVPPVSAPSSSHAARAIGDAAGHVVGQLSETWVSRAGAERYLPLFLARAIRASAGADAGFVPSSQLFTQAPLDGTVAALRAGPVTDLDLRRLFPFDVDDIVVVELRAGELARLVAAHDGSTDPTNRTADGRWWNWARLPAGTATIVDDPRTLAVDVFFAPLLASWLGRELDVQPIGRGGRHALARWLEEEEGELRR